MPGMSQVDFEDSRSKRTARQASSSAKGGDCYQKNGDFILEKNYQPHPGLKDWKLCHGLVTGGGGEVKGIQFGHCWAEFKGFLVYDYSNGNNAVVLIQDYYRAGKIDGDNVIKYTPQELMKMIHKYGTWGPWDEKTKNWL